MTMESTDTSLAALICKHAFRLDTPALMALIQRHHPGIDIDEVIAELRRQAEAKSAEADDLRAYARRKFG